jgi:aminoglycoside phosphotransferase (APT) family kinase protein
MGNQELDVTIDVDLVKRLITSQFPEWQSLPVKPVSLSGWDNRTFHLGDDMLVRLPSHAVYASQVEKEQKWLPKLAPYLPFKISEPLAMGNPGQDYPWHWSIYRYLPGTPAAIAETDDLCLLAEDLARFLIAFEKIDVAGGPFAGEHSFHRGGSLSIYNAETQKAISLLKDKIDATLAAEIWEKALKTSWEKQPVWVHGDLSPGNLLIDKGRLCAVIDFGQLAVGDPACDLAITWTFFKDKSREVFRNAVAFDSGTWARARGWALWKALIVASGLTGTNATEASKAMYIIDEVFNDHSKSGDQI